MKNSNNSIDSVYAFRNDNIIIGLTGRTGSGCSTVANLLKTESFKDLPKTENSRANDYAALEENLKQEIVYNYMDYGDHWRKFDVIEVSAIILSFVLEGGRERLIGYIENLNNNLNKNKKEISLGQMESLRKIINSQSKYFDEIQKYNLDNTCSLSNKKECLDFYLKTILNFKQTIKIEFDRLFCYETVRKNSGIQTTKLNLYTFLMQKIGNNLRATGEYDKEETKSGFTNVIVGRIDKIIQLIESVKGKKRVCIDALRNPLEILYFKDRYRCFYAFSINVDEESRCKRLKQLSEEELKNLDRVEYPKKYEQENEFFFHQDIQKCIEFADVHINNPDVDKSPYFFLTSQLLKYISLIIHPGLISPSKNERCMQIAYNAKLNSGCLSRQVGAVITNETYSIKAVGWNDAPSTQMPCSLRTVDNFCQSKDKNCFSQYELMDDDFIRALSQIKKKKEAVDMRGLPYRYCFKDVFNAIQKDKNQVHTRSLHAEENAFLQLSKDGGIGIKGGKLFVTASPCELCSKKSYQLGIKDIYYIDPYPGIAQNHILGFGKSENRPKVHLYNGVVGEKFVELYLQRISPKDEIAFLCGFSNRSVINDIYAPQIEGPKYSEIEYQNIKIDFIFNSRTEIKCETSYSLIPKIEGINQLEFILSWTGSHFDDVKCEPYNTNVLQTGNETLHKYRIDFGETLEKDKTYDYKVTTNVRDLNMVMLSYIVQRIKYVTKKLSISLIYKVSDEFINPDSIRATKYADLNMEQLLDGQGPKLEMEKNGDLMKYTMVEEQPVLNYTYGIEWQFME